MPHFISAEPSSRELAAFAKLTGSAQGSSSGAPPDERGRVILIFGYWPPTDIGIAGTRSVPNPTYPPTYHNVSGHGMFWHLRVPQTYRGYRLVAPLTTRPALTQMALPSSCRTGAKAWENLPWTIKLPPRSFGRKLRSIGRSL
jgi:hypothetical protein